MLLKNGRVLNSNFTFETLDILISEGKISDLYSSCKAIYGNEAKVLDLTGLTVLPGLIDIHTHGCNSYDTMDATYEAINAMSEYQAKNGVTSFMPTTMTESITSLKNALTNIYKAVQKGVKGANIPGVYMEGPYFSKKYKGAQNEKYLKSPSFDEFKELQEACGNMIRIVSIAPELEGAMEFIKKVSELGITVSMGHTEADYNTAVKAIENGVSHVTHLFNAMPPFHHREPRVVGAAFDKKISVELICDGIHLHPSVIRTAIKAVTPEKSLLISDSMRATGLNDGLYNFGGQVINVENEIARTETGALAGSTTPLFYCVKKAVEYGIRLEDAVKMASINPARQIGADKYTGSIEIGKDADLVVINDRFEIVYTFVKGVLIGI